MAVRCPCIVLRFARLCLELRDSMVAREASPRKSNHPNLRGAIFARAPADRRVPMMTLYRSTT
jgi:hypothetical protein